MEWQDEAIVLSARKHGESAAIVQLLTARHGRHAGLVRGGAGRRARGLYQPGNEVTAAWRARLSEHLGTFTCELARSHAAGLLRAPAQLAALSAASALAELCLPEREPYPGVYAAFRELLRHLQGEHWGEAYVRWELRLLTDLGFGLDLSACAATGRNDELAYVSPKSGRAVSLSAGEPYRDKLLPLPAFLIGDAPADPESLAAGLRLTGFFLGQEVLEPIGAVMPAARERLASRLR